MVDAFTAAQQWLDEDRYDLEVLAGRLAEHGVAAYSPQKGALNHRRLSGSDNAIVFAKRLFEAEIVPQEHASLQ